MIVILKYNLKERDVHVTTLRKVGGSVMLAVPPAMLDEIGLSPGAKVGLALRRGRLIVEPLPRRRYTLDALLAQCNPRARRGKAEREWLAGAAVGRELL
jgi:antitoxin ChpS